MLRAKVGAQIPLTERQGRNRDRVVGTVKSARTFNSSRPQQWSLHTEPLNHAVSRRLADSNRWKASEHKEHVNAPQRRLLRALKAFNALRVSGRKTHANDWVS